MIPPRIKKERAPRKNEQIRISPVKVLAEDGELLGEMPTEEALLRAQTLGLDLIEISPNQRPPICKIMDFGKHLYDLKKREKLKKAGAKKTEVKEVRIGFATGEHDRDVTRRKAEKFLAKGNRVKVVLRMKGREQAHKALAVEKLKQFVGQIENGEQDAKIEAQGRFFHTVVRPKK